MSAAVLYLALPPFLALAGALGVLAWARPSGWVDRIARPLGWISALLAAMAWGLRWTKAGHLPLFGTYESALSLAAAVLSVAVGWDLARRGLARATPWACFLAAALLLHGLRYDPTPYALTISERSWVVDVHAVLAWLAFAALTVNAAVAAMLVLKRDGPDDLSAGLTRTLHAGFVLHSGMMATGSIYKFMLFGKAWSFDPIETLAFAAWVAYGTLLHLNLLAGWKGRRLAGWCLFVFVILIVSYRGIVYFPSWSTYHIFDMDLRLHIGPS